MYNYKVKIQYDGSRYKGWQKLSNGENTIQNKLESTISLLLEEDINIIGCSRTDAGVHAKGQTANFYVSKELDERLFIKEINRKLPEDIAIISIEAVDERFHARYNAKRKMYSYTINTGYFPDPFMRKYQLHIDGKLNINRMKAAAVYFIGEHDFSTFTNAKSKKKSMVREIYSLDIFEDKDEIRIEIEGNGFLHNMIRRIVGVLIIIGTGKNSPEDVLKMLNVEDRSMVEYIAEAKGLCLERIDY